MLCGATKNKQTNKKKTVLSEKQGMQCYTPNTVSGKQYQHVENTNYNNCGGRRLADVLCPL